MSQFGGKDSKRHFTVVMGNKEHGLYVSSSPSSAARKAVTKLCAANKSKKVVFHIRETTQDSKKKTYGPYTGYIEKLKEPIELKGRVIKYKPVAKLIRGKSVKKGGMFRPSGGPAKPKCIHDRNFEGNIRTTLLRLSPDEDKWVIDEDNSPILLEHGEEVVIINRNIRKNPEGDEYFYIIKKNNGAGGLVKAKYIKCPAEVRVQLPSINNFLNSTESFESSKQNNNSLLSGFQPNYKNKKSGQPAILSGFSGQPANLSRFPEQSARLSGFSGQPASLFEVSEQPASLSGFSGQSARLSRFTGQLNKQDFKKLYNCLHNSELLQSIGGKPIPGISIPKLQVIDLLGEENDLTGRKFGKIRFLSSLGKNVEGFVPFENLKKTRWCCNHEFCLKFNGPYDTNQVSNKGIPVTVANILKNDKGEILVATETDRTKTSESNSSLPGYHVFAGRIELGKKEDICGICPIFTSYDEASEESRFLPVEERGGRNFRLWDAMFKPDRKYRMEPWVSSGRALVFVGEIGDKFWDASNPPYGEEQTFTNLKQLDQVFAQLRRILPETYENHKYKEKINFKWVTPLPKGRSESNWKDWSRDNQMYDWGRKIIQDYVEHSTEPAQLEPRLQNFLNFLPPSFSRGMSESSNRQSVQSASLSGGPAQSRHRNQGNNGQSASLSEPDFLHNEVLKKAEGSRIEKVNQYKYIIHKSDNHRIIMEGHLIDGEPLYFSETPEFGPQVLTEENFDRAIERSIESKMRTSVTYLNDLLDLCRETYLNMLSREIPKKKLNELKASIMRNPIKEKGSNPLFYKS